MLHSFLHFPQSHQFPDKSLQFHILFKIKSFPKTKFLPGRERLAGGAGGGAGRLDLRAPGLAGLTRQVLLLHLLLLQNC